MRILKDSLASLVGTDASIWADICLSGLGPPASSGSSFPLRLQPWQAVLGWELIEAGLRLAYL